MLVAEYPCFCLSVFQLCSAELAQLTLADSLTLFKYLSSAGCFSVYQIYVFFLWRRFYIPMIVFLVFLDEGCLFSWALWRWGLSCQAQSWYSNFGVLSLVSFFGLNFSGPAFTAGELRFFGYFPQKVAVFGSELACIQGRGVTATSLRKLRFLGLNWPAFKAGELRLLPTESCGFWVEQKYLLVFCF